MTISIIIPTCDRNDLLANCLDRIDSQRKALASEILEVIVSDDSKTHAAKELIERRYKWVNWVAGPRRGPAANRNNAVKASKGEWLVFTDDDCLPQQSWLASYIAAIKLSPATKIFEGKTIADREKRRFDEESPLNESGNNLWSCNFAIRASLFKALGGFDESFPFPAMEDVDFYIRARETAEIKFIETALIVHPWRKVKAFKKLSMHLKSHKHFAKKYQLLDSSEFRKQRIKIFLGSVFFDLKELIRFSLKGSLVYVDRCLFNFCMIFI